MIYAFLYLATLLLAIAMDRRGVYRPLMIAAFPLFVLDCIANMLVCGNSWRNTLSAESWRQREHEQWGWCWQAVDAFFGVGHCERQSDREHRYGSAWGAWLAGWNGR